METRAAEEILDSLGLGHSFVSLGARLRLSRRTNAEAEIERAPGNPNGPQQDWWNTAYGRWRLEAEEQAMREHFPGFETVLAEEGETGKRAIAWRGWLQSGLPGGDRYLVYVAYCAGFPDLDPAVIIAAPELPGPTPHLLFGQAPCLYDHSGSARGYDPASTTAATLVAWTALWIHAYETWKKTGTWPGRGA